MQNRWCEKQAASLDAAVGESAVREINRFQDREVAEVLKAVVGDRIVTEVDTPEWFEAFHNYQQLLKVDVALSRKILQVVQIAILSKKCRQATFSKRTTSQRKRRNVRKTTLCSGRLDHLPITWQVIVQSKTLNHAPSILRGRKHSQQKSIIAAAVQV